MAVVDEIETLAGGLAGVWSVAAENLATGQRIEWGSADELVTASAGKTLILLTWAALEATKAIDASVRRTVTADDRVRGTGVLQFCDPGLALTTVDLAMLMTTVSDNMATNLVLESIGGSRVVNDFLVDLGIVDAHVHGPISFESGEPFATATTSALADVYRVIAEPSARGYPEPAARRCGDLLFRQQVTHFLTRFLPSYAPAWDFGFAQPVQAYTKYGAMAGTSADAGLFVSRRGAYTLAVIGNDTSDRTGSPDEDGPRFIAEVGAACWRRWGDPEAKRSRRVGQPDKGEYPRSPGGRF